MQPSHLRAPLWDALTRPEDLPDSDLREIARELGMDAVRYLVTSWGGTQIYIPTEQSVLRPAIRETIRREWNGRNEAELARRFGLSRRVVFEALEAAPPAPDPTQARLF